MDQKIIDDTLLYEHMEKVEKTLLNTIPAEQSLKHEFSKSYRKKISHLLKTQKRSPFVNRIIKYSKGIAAIFIVFISIAFTSVMSVEAYRERFFEIVTEIWTEFTSVIFQTEENSSDTLIPAELNHIPNGFKKTEERVYPYEYYLCLENDTGNEIIFEQTPINANAFIIDTEDTEVETIKIADQQINSFTNKNLHQFYWNDNKYMYSLISEYDKNELIKIIKNILEKNR